MQGNYNGFSKAGQRLKDGPQTAAVIGVHGAMNRAIVIFPGRQSPAFKQVRAPENPVDIFQKKIIHDVARPFDASMHPFIGEIPRGPLRGAEEER